jgi:hypothetical protein
MKISNILNELNATQQARVELGNLEADKDERIQNARMSDQDRVKKREQEILDMERSEDPIDKKIAQLQKQIAALMQQKSLKQAGVQ